MPATQEQLAEQHAKKLEGRTLKRMNKKDKIKHLKQQFFFFDVDASGTLTADEFLNVLTMAHGKAEGLTLDDAREILADFDRDGNGSLDVEEFIKAMIAMDPMMEDEEDEDDDLFAAADAAAVGASADEREKAADYS